MNQPASLRYWSPSTFFWSSFVTMFALHLMALIATGNHSPTGRHLTSLTQKENTFHLMISSGTSGSTLPHFHHRVSSFLQTAKRYVSHLLVTSNVSVQRTTSVLQHNLLTWYLHLCRDYRYKVAFLMSSSWDSTVLTMDFIIGGGAMFSPKPNIVRQYLHNNSLVQPKIFINTHF